MSNCSTHEGSEELARFSQNGLGHRWSPWPCKVRGSCGDGTSGVRFAQVPSTYSVPEQIT